MNIFPCKDDATYKVNFAMNYCGMDTLTLRDIMSETYTKLEYSNHALFWSWMG